MRSISKHFPIFALLFLLHSCNLKNNNPYTEWRICGGSKENLHYSSLAQIDSANLNRLKIAWIYHTGDADTAHSSQIQCNPVIIEGILYGTSPKLKLFALDAATGKEKWVFDPQDPKNNKAPQDFALNNNRGVTYWEEGAEKRVFYTAGSFLYALDATKGTLIGSFGDQGKIDLHDGLGREAKQLFVVSTSPGIIYKDLIILGTRVSEGSDAAPGHIRAYDVRTGIQRWIFHTIPQPGEYGYDTWEDPVAWKFIGGANCWSGFALDEKRGLLFAPTGSASFDFYGGKRKGAGLFADCLLALDAATGKYRWHFQDVHHDVWDRDLPTPPALVTVQHEGRETDAVAQPTKTGFLFLLDRETGKPLFPVEEKPVPTNSELEGEKIYPTQPFPTLPKPYMRQHFFESDLNDLLPDSSFQEIKQRFASYKTGDIFNPLSKEGTVVYPGLDGGAEWGGPAFDPLTGLLYINANEIPWVLTIIDRKTETPRKENYRQAGSRIYEQTCISCHGPDRKGSGNYPSILDAGKKYDTTAFYQLISGGRRMMPAFKQLSAEEKKALAIYILNMKTGGDIVFTHPQENMDTFRNLPYTITGYTKFQSREGYPAIKPPWGTLNAINLNTGESLWRIPLGEYPELKAKGLVTGAENYGGPVVTAGGLLIIAATPDSKIRVFNKRNGELLWSADLPAAGFATPSVYQAEGKEYIVIACGGGKLKKKSGDAYIAFSLEDK